MQSMIKNLSQMQLEAAEQFNKVALDDVIGVMTVKFLNSYIVTGGDDARIKVQALHELSNYLKSVVNK